VKCTIFSTKKAIYYLFVIFIDGYKSLKWPASFATYYLERFA